MLKLIVLAVACLAVSGSSNKKRGIREGASRVKRSDIACGENEFFFRDKCYLFSTEKVLGDVTKGLCENYGGELVSFSSDEEFDFLKDTIKMDPNLDGLSYWTGAINQRHKWRWVTGEKIKNKYWVHGKPTSKRNRNCGSMSPDDDYYLVNLKCRGHYQGFICERGNTPQNRYAMESGGCKCMVSGDPHYMTCDGKKHDFQGNCTYITFLDNLHPDQPYFKVMAKNSYDPKKKKMVTLQEHITVEIFHPSFTQSYTFSFSRDNVVHLNGVNVSPPSNPEEGILLTSVGKKIMLQTVFGFWMTWDFVSRTEMRAPPEYRNNIGGMCGNCDGNPDNDYFAPDGSLTSTSNMYGNSWKSGTSCPDTDQEVDECIPERVALYGENDKCGKIGDTSGHFANCINGLGQEVVDEFLQNCIYDMCYIGGDDTLCQSIGSFYDECLYNEIEIETFRSATFCPLECPNNSVYNPSAPPCENTCAEPTAAESCPDKNMEMCLCIEGYVRSGYECVPSTECGCFGADNIYRVRDETWTDSSCTHTCICTEDGSNCTDIQCDENSACVPVDGVYTCVCRDGYEGDGFTCTPIDKCAASAVTPECSLIGGMCKSSCEEGENLAMNKLLCPKECFCCHPSTDLCSTSHFGAFCYPKCQESMVALDDSAFCEGWPETRECCKPRRIPGEGYYNPDPVEVNGEEITPAIDPENPPETAAEATGTGPPGEGAAVKDDLAPFGESLGGLTVPENLGHGDGGGAGGFGDPIMETGDGFRFRFEGDACEYIMFQEDVEEPSFRVVSRHVGGSILGKKAYFIGHVAVDFNGQHVQLQEGNIIKVDGKNVTDKLSTRPTSFENISIEWKNLHKKFVLVNFGPNVFSVVWNGYEGHVNINASAELSGKVTGILGNFNGDKEDDLRYKENGEWKTIPLQETKRYMDRFSKTWLANSDSC